MNKTERLAIGLFGWRWMSYIGIPIRGTEGYPTEMRVRRLLSPETIEHWQRNENLQLQCAAGDEPLCYAYYSSGGGPLLPDCLAHNDDYGVLQQARRVWPKESAEWKAFVAALPRCCDYREGSFATAALKALGPNST